MLTGHEDCCEYEFCRDNKSWEGNRARGKYCSLRKCSRIEWLKCEGVADWRAPTDTCRNDKCRESVDDLALFCGKREKRILMFVVRE